MSSIFLVEDDEYIGRVYERAFRLNGHTVTIVMDGEAALKQLTSMNPLPEAVIMDVMMPKMNGEELLRTVRKDERFAHVPIAVLTNSFHEESKHKFLELGANLYMVKIDFKPQEVVHQIEALIPGSRKVV